MVSREPRIIAQSPALQHLLELARRYAAYDATILVTGESGTGKEVIARYIHSRSPRSSKPLVVCNLAALPESLVESELFGYVKGAFTGATGDKKGLLEAAEGGTLCLDEIGEISLSLQVKLLRLLENREYYKLGDTRLRKSSARIIAATNKNLDKAIAQKTLRADFYYRLAVACIAVPPLRERREDILPLAEHFVAQTCWQIREAKKRMSGSFSSALQGYGWPGNVRELKNAVQSAVLVVDGEALEVSDLPMHVRHDAPQKHEESPTEGLRKIEEAERKVINEAVQTAGNKADAARLLGISKRTLYRKLKRS